MKRMVIVLMLMATVIGFASVVGAANKKVIVIWTSATVRSGADNTSSSVTNVKKGDELTVIRESGQWLNVRLEDGKEGWINSRFVEE